MEDASAVHYINRLIEVDGELCLKSPVTDGEVNGVPHLEVELGQC